MNVLHVIIIRAYSPEYCDVPDWPHIEAVLGVKRATVRRWLRTHRWPVGTLHKLDPKTYDEKDKERDGKLDPLYPDNDGKPERDVQHDPV